MQVAMNSDGDYSYPSHTPAEKRLPVIRKLRKQCSANEWFCPHCYARSRGENRHPVSLVNPKAKIIHFRHKSGDRSKDCKNYSGESDKHLTAKMALLDRWTNDKHTVQIETRKYGATEFRIPDVMVSTLSGEVHAHEVQVSKINVSMLETRTESLFDIGCKQVHWYLYGPNVKDENVNYLIRRQNAYAYRLQFDDDGTPEWRPLTTEIRHRVKSPEATGQTFPRFDTDGIAWIYYRPADTIAKYFGKDKQRYRIALPGDGPFSALPSEVLDPASMATGGLGRWPMLQGS